MNNLYNKKMRQIKSFYISSDWLILIEKLVSSISNYSNNASSTMAQSLWCPGCEIDQTLHIFPLLSSIRL